MTARKSRSATAGTGSAGTGSAGTGSARTGSAGAEIAGPPDGTLGPASLPDHLPRWLEAVSRRLSADLGTQLRSSGLVPDVRGSDRRILQMIPPGAIKITELATLAGMTKQALGEFVDRLERAGFVSSGKDPSDGRVRLVSLTARGDAVATATAEAIEAVENRWRAEIGPDAYEAMIDALRRLGGGAALAGDVLPRFRTGQK
jgi:DNA-binding MarR family transcriptional regulator